MNLKKANLLCEFSGGLKAKIDHHSLVTAFMADTKRGGD